MNTEAHLSPQDRQEAPLFQSQPGIPGLRGGLFAELSKLVDDERGRGGCSLAIGADALERAAGEGCVLSEASHVLHVMLQALRSPITSDHPTEIILAAFASWAILEDIPTEARSNFMSLLEAAFAGLDQNNVQGAFF